MYQHLALAVLLAIMASGYQLGRKRSLAVVGGCKQIRALHSLPSYYGAFVALWSGLPALLLLAVWLALENPIITSLMVADLPEATQTLPAAELNLVINDIRNIAEGNIASSTINADDPATQAAARHYNVLKHTSAMLLFSVVLALAAAGLALALRLITPQLRARNSVETIIRWLMIACSAIAILITIGIVLSVLFESLRFFDKIALTDFLFGLQWSPQTAMYAGQVGASSGAFGIIPLFTGTLLISAIAMLVAVPIGLLSAMYLSEYASQWVRTLAKPILEILAGVPTVVYGFFAALVVAPAIRDLGTALGLTVASESALAAGLIMGIMIIPFVSSLSDDVINAVPQAMRDGSYALGATRSETIAQIVFPAALQGIVGAILLAASRAIGETMIVVMAAGLSAKLTANPLDAVTTVTVQIVTLLVGDQEFDSAKTLAAFALGLVLFIVTLILNIIAIHIVRKYKEQYE